MLATSLVYFVIYNLYDHGKPVLFMWYLLRASVVSLREKKLKTRKSTKCIGCLTDKVAGRKPDKLYHVPMSFPVYLPTSLPPTLPTNLPADLPTSASYVWG